MFKLFSFLCKCISGSKSSTNKSIDEIKVTVDKAIEKKDPREIDNITEQRDLMIAQKYLDQLISDKGLKLSYISYVGVIVSFMIAFLGFGVTYFLTGSSIGATTNVGTGFKIIGALIIIVAVGGGVYRLWTDQRVYGELEKQIRFMQNLVLEIEGRLEK